MMKPKVTTILCLMLLVSAAGVAAPTQQKVAAAADLNKMPIARVNGDPITVQEVLSVFNDRHSGHSKFLGGDVELRKFLSIVLDDRLLVQEAYEIGLDQDPAVVQAAERIERKRIVQTLVREEIEIKARPTEDDINRVWETLDTIRQVRQITVRTRAEAEEIRAAVLRGADIDYFARNCSTSRSRLNGGHLMVMWGNFAETWEEAVFPLEPGEVSPVIETPEGFDVILVENRVQTARPELASVKADIESTLYKRRLEARKREYAEVLWTRYHAELAPLSRDPRVLGALLAEAPETVVATWEGGGKLTLADSFSAEDLQQLAAFPAGLATDEIEKRIRVTVNEPLVALDGKARKLAERPDIADEVSSVREYTMEAILYRDHIFKSMDTTDDEVKAYYDAHKTEFQSPARRRVAQILVATEAEAKALRAKLDSGAEFETLARQSSRDFVTAPKGGDLGWITAEKVPPSFAEILTLLAGQVSKPVDDAAGWHLIKVLETEEQTIRGFDEVKEQVKNRVLDTKKRAARSTWVEKLRAVSKIEIDDAAIKAFVAANQFDEKAAPPQHGLQ